jgi:2-polyprenyl-3-methyl-5-hydroxy-6-metoxy-1,4-benzoquinol methylase
MDNALRASISDTARVSCCPLCGSADIGFKATGKRYAFDSCNACRYIFANPMPTMRELEALYVKPRGDAAEDREFPKARTRMRKALARALRFLPYIVGKRALDLGCGGGFMVEAMRVFGARASGLDINPRSIAYARNRFPKCAFFDEDFESFAARGLAFDFVYCSDVLEHVSDLKQTMDFLDRIVKPGGHVYINTPDAAHPKVPRDITRWDVFDDPQHVHFFTLENARILFARAGFDIVRSRRHRKPGLHFVARKRRPA